MIYTIDPAKWEFRACIYLWICWGLEKLYSFTPNCSAILLTFSEYMISLLWLLRSPPFFPSTLSKGNKASPQIVGYRFSVSLATTSMCLIFGFETFYFLLYNILCCSLLFFFFGGWGVIIEFHHHFYEILTFGSIGIKAQGLQIGPPM